MNPYNPYRRFLLSIVVTLLLGGVFLGFRAVTSPFLEVERTQQKFTPQDSLQHASTEVVSEARKWFPDHPWVADSKKHFHDVGRYLYCRDFGLKDNDKTVTVSPIAMILHSESGKRPVTILADSARLESSTSISPNATEFGRIVAGALTGNVIIEGPDGLKIEGRSFRLDEETLKLWTIDPVKFRMQEHRGYARAGVDIYLAAPVGGGDGLTNVTDVKRIRLNGRVVCEFFLPAEKVSEKDQEIRVNAAGGFSFDMLTRTGAFSGLQPPKGEQKLRNSRNEVLVTRAVAGKVTDRLLCPELMMRFRDALPSEKKSKTNNSSVKLEHIKAWGRQVLYKSLEHDLTINANEFGYAPSEGRIDIYRTNSVVRDGKPSSIELISGGNTLRVPHIRVLHATDKSVQRVEFNGKGEILGETKPDKQGVENGEESKFAFGATWLKSLTMQFANDKITRVVSLNGGATVSEPSRDFQLKADTIAMKLVQAPAVSAELPSTTGVSRVSYTKVETKSNAQTDGSEFDVNALRPKLMTAVGNVTLTSPQGIGKLRDRLTVKFEDILTANPTKTVSSSDESKVDGESTDEDDSNSNRFFFESDSLEAVVGVSLDPENREVEPRNVWLNGDVKVRQQSQKENQNFAATGNQLHATGTSVDDLKIKLFGDPARLTNGVRNVEGPRIDVSAIDSEAKVVGSGRIRFQIKTGFDGRKLVEPTPLEIYWSDHMVFHKRSAEFVGNIRVVMDDGVTQDIEIACAGMTVHFNKDLVLGETDDKQKFDAIPAKNGAVESGPDTGSIERLECHDAVTVHVNQWLDGEPIGRHAAEFANLKLNIETGDFTAIGQGYLESVSPDKNGQLQGSAPAVARANTPSQTLEYAFAYVKVEFIGDLTGNLDRKEARLTHNVMALFAPVQRIDDELNLDVPTSDLPENSGILLSEVLTISALETGDDDTNSFAIVARDNARLRSRDLSATGADVITYDHQKQQFIMKAEGRGTVRVNHKDGRSNSLNSLSGKRFEYYRANNQLSADGLGGLRLEE